MDETEALLRAVLPPVVTCRGVTTTLDRFERLTLRRRLRPPCRRRPARHGRRRAGARALRPAPGLRDGEDLGGPVLPPAARARRAAIGRAAPDLPDPLAGAAGGARPARSGRPARGAALRAVRLRHRARQRLRGTDRRRRAARPLRGRPRAPARAAPAPDWPLDEDFLAALAHGMPAGAGIALGFDRLAMIASGASRIDQVLWLPE